MRSGERALLMDVRLISDDFPLMTVFYTIASLILKVNSLGVNMTVQVG